jgi:uncharacterized phage-associated protein
VANWFIDKNKIDQLELIHLKIQKLLYLAQGFYLANRDKLLFEDPIEAWEYGPVIRSIYDYLNFYDIKQQVSEKIILHTPQNGNYTALVPIIASDDLEINSYLASFWNEYAQYNLWDFNYFSHQQGSPWEKTITALKNGIVSSQVIPIELIKSYFTVLIENDVDK